MSPDLNQIENLSGVFAHHLYKSERQGFTVDAFRFPVTYEGTTDFRPHG